MTALHPNQDRWLNLPLEIRDEAGFRSARSVTYIVVGVLGALAFWAAVAPIAELAVAPGQIVPEAPVSEVHHLEGGIVDSVFVKPGDHVRRGQVLVHLRPEQSAGDLAQLETRAAGLRLKSIRLAASLLEHHPDFGDLGKRYPQLRDEQRLAFVQEAAQARDAHQQLTLAVERLGGQIASAESEAASLKAQVGLQEEQTTIRQQSHERGYTSLHTLLQARSSLEEARQRLIAANGRIAETRKMQDEARAKLQEASAERLRKLAEERADIGAQLAEADEALGKYRDRVARLDVRAPVDGIVQALGSDVRGEVVKPGGLVAQIIPGGTVVAEVELDPRDIGHVSSGNDAEIRMTNYDPNVVGILRGKVESISATTFETKDNRSFYRVRIALDRDSLPPSSRDLPILPGMTLQAQLLTGSKSLMRYMLKPIYQSFNSAFSER
jgi:membrane fusion protein, adhesin transport system